MCGEESHYTYWGRESVWHVLLKSHLAGTAIDSPGAQRFGKGTGRAQRKGCPSKGSAGLVGAGPLGTACLLHPDSGATPRTAGMPFARRDIETGALPQPARIASGLERDLDVIAGLSTPWKAGATWSHHLQTAPEVKQPAQFR
ncbi:hypothetical protein GCM10027072_77940 [Streptomyces bullii]